jgi:hypothetical protein
MRCQSMMTRIGPQCGEEDGHAGAHRSCLPGSVWQDDAPPASDGPLTAREHAARWSLLSPAAQAYARLWDVTRADTDDALVRLFGADPARVEELAGELFETFPEWTTADGMPEHGAVVPRAD